MQRGDITARHGDINQTSHFIQLQIAAGQLGKEIARDMRGGDIAASCLDFRRPADISNGEVTTSNLHLKWADMYARIGRKAVRHEPVELKGLLSQVTESLAPRVAEAGARLSLADNLPMVIGDQTLLAEIFTNLLDNALIYRRPEAIPNVVVDSQTQDGYSTVSVRDNGIGIPAEYHQKIFNVFQRLHSEDEYPGTGIGLAIVKKSVELLGGQVWVESVVGEGSSFYVRLQRSSA